MEDPLLDAQIRSARYWHVDGLSELAIGLQVLLVPVSVFGVAHTSRGSVGRVAVVLALAAGLPAAALLSGRILVAIRSRFTYPRTGFVTYQGQPTRSWVYGAALALALVMLFLALRGVTANWVAWLFVLQGLVPGALTFYYGRLVGLPRFAVTGLLYAAFGVAIAIADPGLMPGMMIFWTGMAAVFLCSGAWTFWRYRRSHPSPAEDS